MSSPESIPLYRRGANWLHTAAQRQMSPARLGIHNIAALEMGRGTATTMAGEAEVAQSHGFVFLVDLQGAPLPNLGDVIEFEGKRYRIGGIENAMPATDISPMYEMWCSPA